MTRTKFTPGTWSIRSETVRENEASDGHELYSAYIYSEAEPKYRGFVCSLQSCDHIDGITRDEARANAQLIAASPELYEFVAYAEPILRANGWSEKADEMQAVLRKARGESS